MAITGGAATPLPNDYACWVFGTTSARVIRRRCEPVASLIQARLREPISQGPLPVASFEFEALRIPTLTFAAIGNHALRSAALSTLHRRGSCGSAGML